MLICLLAGKILCGLCNRVCAVLAATIKKNSNLLLISVFAYESFDTRLNLKQYYSSVYFIGFVAWLPFNVFMAGNWLL